MNNKPAIQRQRKILDYLQNNNACSVEELSKLLHVSKGTIRQDLIRLEDQGTIEPYYKGTKSIQNDNNEEENIGIKHTIAQFAATLVDDGDVIFINTSSTAALMLQYIKNKKVTVVTNNAKLIQSRFDENIAIILSGGEVTYPKHSMIGNFALNSLRQVKSTKTFLGCRGFDVHNGMTTSSFQEVLINSIMIRNCKGPVYILADHTKINVTHEFFVAKAEAFDCLITDSHITDKQRDDFK